MRMKHTLIALLLLFTAVVRIPMKGTHTYKDIVEVHVFPNAYHYRLTLTDGRTVYVPMLWTIIEENK
ncbi:MAG: hypothetical protein V3U54_07640 [Thermodesulfobacteriota bacterium]